MVGDNPMLFNRRHFIGATATLGCYDLSTSMSGAQAVSASSDLTKEEWLDTVMKKKALGQPLEVGRFVERIYYLTKSIGWSPNAGQERFQRVDVPIGFITDFASIPAPF